MMLTRWDPFMQRDRLRRDLDLLWASTLGQGDPEATEIAPPCDVSEDGERFVVTMDAPGLDREAIDVRVEDDTLTLRGKREIARDEKRGPLHLRERRSGTFLRAFKLPASVEAEKVSAEYKEGVLVVSLPKRAEARPRQIEVKVK